MRSDGLGSLLTVRAHAGDRETGGDPWAL